MRDTEGKNVLRGKTNFLSVLPSLHSELLGYPNNFKLISGEVNGEFPSCPYMQQKIHALMGKEQVINLMASMLKSPLTMLKSPMKVLKNHPAKIDISRTIIVSGKILQ